jgi:hypothetical protein
MKLGEQWIEIIDGQEHMVKAVRPVELCQGCLYNGNGGGCWWKGFDDECEMGSRFIIKDLGILNKDGCLPCPFCGEYPIINSDYNDENKKCFDIICTNEECGCSCETLFYLIKQEAIDAWNRRA